jgi:hypothetical protein
MNKRDVDKQATGNRPVETLRDGALKVAIFRNERKDGESYSMVPGRVYTDEATGEKRESTSLGGGEALRMAHLLTKGHDKVAELRAARKTQAPARDRDQERGR